MNLYGRMEDTRAWFTAKGPDEDVVVSSRIRFNRNISGLAFHDNLNTSEKNDIFNRIVRYMRTVEQLKDFVEYPLDSMENWQKGILHERRFIPYRLFMELGAGCLLNPDQNLSVVTGDIDHLRFIAMRSGYGLDRAYRAVNRIHTLIEKDFPFARDETGRFQTVRLRDFGTGLKGTVQMQLTGLTELGELDTVLKEVMQRGIVVKGLFSNDLAPIGNLYMISNEMSYSLSDTEILKNLDEAVGYVLKRERESRKYYIALEKNNFANRVFQAYSYLRESDSLSAQDAMNALSTIRFGIANKLIVGIPLKIFDALFILIQNNHISMLFLNDSGQWTENLVDYKRAEFIKQMLDRYSFK